ncbi:MAG: hypothetical protein EPN86_05750 [Nanoarchaeota archaeon]|nr:MAG: hypothetical protein EPN86_05750 [Nanoarchaeota archaeon]
MKKILITIAFSILLLSACRPQQNNYQNIDTAVMELKTYGGFISPDMAIQDVRVEYGKVTFRIFAENLTLMSETVKPISKEQFENLAKKFIDADFFSFKNSYQSAAKIMDIGKGEISFSIGGKQKTIIIDPYYFDDSIPVSIASLNDELSQMKAFAVQTTAEDAEAIAEKWIKEAPTYKYDGSDLKLESQKELETYPVQHVLTYSFTSRVAGYGDRTGKINAQMAKQHKIDVTVSSGKVTSAVIDGKWDEINQVLVSPQEVQMSFDLMQCSKTPWQEWLDNSDIRFIRAPTEEQVLKMYFENKNINVTGYSKVQENVITCQACGVCWSGTRYFVTVSENDEDQMTRLGWKQDV